MSVVLTQDPQGRMVAIDNGTLMVFDGNTWTSRMNSRTTGSDAVSIACMGPDGNYHAGSVGVWGHLSLLNNGDFQFYSERKDSPGWTAAAHFDGVAPTSKGVFFYSTLGLLFQQYGTLECQYWNDQLPVQLVFEFKGQVYMSAGSGGLFRLVDGNWMLVSGSSGLGGNEAVIRMALRKDGEAILAAQSGKLYLFDGQTISPWVTDCDSMLSVGIVDMIALQSSELAIAVRGYGVIVLNSEGKAMMSLGADHDESFSGISCLFQQENGVLWAALPSGIAKVYYPSQITFYDYRFGVSMHWPEVYHFMDGLVVFSDYRLFLSEYDAVGRINRFKELKISSVDLIESCLGYEDEIIFGSSGSIYSYVLNSQPRLIMSGITSARIKAVGGVKDYVMIFGSDRHALIHRVNGRWVVVQTIPSMGFPAVVLQTQWGDMWVEHGLGRSCRVWLKDGKLNYQDFDNVKGLDRAWLNAWEYKGQVYLSSGNNIRRFDRVTETLVDAPEMLDLMRMIGGEVSRIFESPDGTVWASGIEGVSLIRTVEGRTVVDRDTLRPLSESHALVKFDGDNVAWILSRNRIIRYNSTLSPPEYKKLIPKPYLVTSTISSSGRADMLHLGSDSSSAVSLPYERNNIMIRLFPNTYSLPSPPSYRYRLSGVNSTWTSPVNEPLISFTNLHEGEYRLDVELLDQDISVGAVSSFFFDINPPWMRTWYAFFSYFCVSIAVILTAVRIAQRRSELERKRLEKLVTSRTRELDDTNTRLRESIKSAMAAAEAKSRFLANMSHEIRTPMNGVVGTTELLARTSLDGEQKELVDIINKSGSLLLSIVNDVLDYSKIEADQLVFELIPLRPQTLLDDVLEILGEKANEKSVDFFGSIDPGVPYELIGDTTRLQQVLVNLASNALKFTEHGEVEIKGWAKERTDGRWDLHFSVRDTGIGMDPRRMNRLFKAFSQLDASNTRVYGGTGLGLAISKRLIERMGGVLDVSSEIGEGSCFQFSIPLPASDRRAPDESNVVVSGSILLVDDCSTRLEAISQYLSTNGLTVKTASGAQAVAILSEGTRFDVVVADCAVDNEDWRDVADAVYTKCKGVPLVVYRRPLQAVDHPAVVRRLTKPWRCNRLISELKGCLDVDLDRLAKGSGNFSDEDLDLSLTKLRVLLAEDNVVNQRVGVLLLGKLGIKPDLVANGQEAVDLVHTREYDIVLMDVQMPVMDGIQATQAIRRSLRGDEQPIIVALTAGAMSSDREAAFAAGVDAYLTKPLRLETLREQLNDLLEKVTMRRSARR
ncbi:MAG: response regulator [Opitutales bacterium]